MLSGGKKVLLSVLFGIFMLLSVASMALVISADMATDTCETVVMEGRFGLVGEPLRLEFSTENSGSYGVMLELQSDEGTDFDELLYGGSAKFSAKTELYKGEDIVSGGYFSDRMPPVMAYRDEGLYRVQLASFEAEPGGRYTVVFRFEDRTGGLGALNDARKKVWVEDMMPSCQRSAVSTVGDIAAAVLVISLIATVVLGLRLRKTLAVG